MEGSSSSIWIWIWNFEHFEHKQRHCMHNIPRDPVWSLATTTSSMHYNQEETATTNRKVQEES